MDVRASDIERDACVEQLRTAAAEGRLTFEELGDRIEAASRAVMRGELLRLTADLPRSLVISPTEPLDVAAMGSVKRSGHWVVPPESRFRSRLGSIKLDLRRATISASEVRIDAFTPFGTVDILVPEGVEVEVRASSTLGQLNVETGAVVPGAPRIVLTGGSVFGTVRVRNRRMWNKLFAR